MNSAVNERNFKAGATATTIVLIVLFVAVLTASAINSTNHTERFVACIDSAERTALECREATA